VSEVKLLKKPYYSFGNFEIREKKKLGKEMGLIKKRGTYKHESFKLD